MDKASGIFADKDKVHRLNFAGDFFKVRGPLNVPRPVQGYPIIVQAGGSEDGRNLAAKHADLNFALLRTIEEGQAYRQDFDTRLQKFGRPASALKILPGILPIVASSMDEAAEKEALLEKLVPEQVGVDLVSSWVGIDLSASPIDGPIPPLPDEASFNGQRTNLIKVKQYQKEGRTIREVAGIVANVGTAPTFKGTPKQIADQCEEWYTAKAADGFNLMFPTIPEDWMQFMKEVVPELRRRNLVPQQYAPGTLRDRLNLPKPINQFAKTPQHV
jgi:FMN-dependent oxidoreductase (nitrilotriacetate monooxygenase family)